MRVGVHSPARFFVSLPFNILGCLSVRSHRQKSRSATARAQSPKNLFASTHLCPAQQSRVRSEHVSKEMGGVLAPPFISERFLVGLSFRKQTTPFSWTASATCLDIVNRYTLFCVFSPTAIHERCEAYVILIPYRFALCLLDINQVFQLFYKKIRLS